MLLVPAVLGFLVVAAAGCGSQRRVGCAPRADDFSVKVTLVPGSKTGLGDCDQQFDGADSVQVMGMQPFFNAPGASDRVSSLAIQPFETGTYALNALMADPPAKDKNAQDKPYAFGKFTTESPDSKDICHVPTLSAAEIDYDMFMVAPPPQMDAGGQPEAGAGGSDAGGDGGASDAAHTAAQAAAPPATAAACTPPDEPTPQTMFPAKHVKYELSNLQIYVTVALTGSIMAGDLTYTQTTPAGVCSAKFKLRGVSASVSCADECGKPSNKLCDTAPGIPNDIKTMCDPESMLCVLNDGTRKDIPADTHIPQ